MIKAVIFDMDGVISDTQKLHAQVDSQILSEYEIIISPDELSDRFAGVRNEDYFDVLLREKGQPYDLKAILKDKWERILKLTDSIEAIPGAINLLKLLSENKLLLALASSSNTQYVMTVLNKLKITKYFSAIITGDMVTNGKPYPEVFLLAASKMNVSPEDCLVIEDGKSGMEAAKKAGMKCIGLVNNLSEKYPTDNLVTSLEEVTLEYLNKL